MLDEAQEEFLVDLVEAERRVTSRSPSNSWTVLQARQSVADGQRRVADIRLQQPPRRSPLMLTKPQIYRWLFARAVARRVRNGAGEGQVNRRLYALSATRSRSKALRVR